MCGFNTIMKNFGPISLPPKRNPRSANVYLFRLKTRGPIEIAQYSMLLTIIIDRDTDYDRNDYNDNELAVCFTGARPTDSCGDAAQFEIVSRRLLNKYYADRITVVITTICDIKYY